MADRSNGYRDPRWQRLRLHVFERDNFTCRHCSTTSRELHAHHINYRKAEVWDYEPDELITLCDSCHTQIEDSIKAVREALAHGGSMPGGWTLFPLDWVFWLMSIAAVSDPDGLRNRLGTSRLFVIRGLLKMLSHRGHDALGAFVAVFVPGEEK